MLFVYIWCVSVYTHFKFNILHMYASMLYYLCMSGQFIPLSQFLSHYKKKKLEQQIKGFKATDML